MIDPNKPELGVKEHIDKILKDMRISYDFLIEAHDRGSDYIFTLHLGSMQGLVMLEVSNDLSENELFYQTFLSKEEYSSPFMQQTFQTKNWDEIEGNIEELINNGRAFNKLKNKIDMHFDAVRDLIKEYNFEYYMQFDDTADDLI